MLLSVIIVNYNTKYFLEQCLHSLYKAINGMQAEVILVDNHSTDGSLPFLLPIFPGLLVISSAENLGFSRASNLGMARASGKFILFLNPDTLISEGTLRAVIAFINENPMAGAVGVRMIDGSGHYLPESKRGLPLPAVAFFRLSGLSSVFPRSRTFAKYYQGHLTESGIHPVDVISGAFMMLRREILERTGGFDEQFFMYGEDIDLSYRILQAGYTNYYLGTETILHFKGESTFRDAQYVRRFYLAMEQFTIKHFRKNFSGPAVWLLLLGIRLRKTVSLLALRLRPGAHRRSTGGPYYLSGDPETISQFLPALQARGIPTVKERSDAQAVILCEGPDYPFRKIFDEIQSGPRGIRYRFHSGGSHCFIGSDTKNAAGEAIAV